MDLTARKALAGNLPDGGREMRRVPASGIELRDNDGGLSLSGWASVTERSYDMGFYNETIKRGAFSKTLSETPDVQLLVNHEGLPLARTISGTLRLSEDERGLRVDADLNPDDPDVQRLAPKVERGDIDQMSFGFRVVRQQWQFVDDEAYDAGERDQRSIIEVNIDRGDVSVVNQGANPATAFSLRDAQNLLSGLSRDEFVEFMRSIEPDESRPPDFDPFAEAMANVRAAATDDQADALQNILNLIDASDTNVDKALIALSSFMGVTNPDIAQDKALDRSADILDTYRARAFALSLAAK